MLSWVAVVIFHSPVIFPSFRMKVSFAVSAKVFMIIVFHSGKMIADIGQDDQHFIVLFVI